MERILHALMKEAYLNRADPTSLKVNKGYIWMVLTNNDFVDDGYQESQRDNFERDLSQLLSLRYIKKGDDGHISLTPRGVALAVKAQAKYNGAY